MILLLVGAGFVLWKSYQLKQASLLDEESVSAPTSEAPAEATPSLDQTASTDQPEAPLETTEEAPLLPPASLEQSDPWLREQLPAINAHPLFLRWLNSESDLIRKTVLLVNHVYQGKVPRKAFLFWAPKDPFKVKEPQKGQYMIDPAGYHRYDYLAEVVNALDAEKTVAYYRLLKPLIDEVFAEFGRPGQTFEAVLLGAIEHLLKTPAVSGEVRLLKPSVLYKYADPALENLSRAQKQLLRMGPVNAGMIKHKLGLIRGLLIGQPEAGT